MPLSREKCVACRRDSPKVTDEEIEELKPTVPEWNLTEKDGVKRLRRTFKTKNFSEALVFANKVGEEAEKEGHHPRITVEWGNIQIDWWTHKINGLHRNDFIMCAKTDETFLNARNSK